MHWIERHILKRLAFDDSLTYTELKPETVEGNLFQYHARQLEKRGLIIRSDVGYTLSPAGKSFVADLSQTKLMNQRKLPRPVVMLAVHNESGEYLMFRWRRQPYRGLVSLPFGRQMYETPSTTMAAEQLLDKTGFEAELRFAGLVDLIFENNGQLIDHLSAAVFIGINLNKVTEPDGLTGEWFWTDPAEFSHDQLVAGTREIINWLADERRPGLLEIKKEA